MSKINEVLSNPFSKVQSMICIKGLIVVLMSTVFTPHVNAAYYEYDMGWTDNSPIALSPVSGFGPIVDVTFGSSRGFTTNTNSTSIGYHHGGSNPVITMSFSSNVTNVELFMVDLDATSEDLDSMSPVPISATGDFYISGSSVRSYIKNGNGSIIYDAISSGELLQFRFDDQLSNLGITELNFQTVPIPGAVWLLGSGLVGLLAIFRKTRLQISY